MFFTSATIFLRLELLCLDARLRFRPLLSAPWTPGPRPDPSTSLIPVLCVLHLPVTNTVPSSISRPTAHHDTRFSPAAYPPCHTSLTSLLRFSVWLHLSEPMTEGCGAKQTAKRVLSIEEPAITAKKRASADKHDLSAALSEEMAVPAAAPDVEPAAAPDAVPKVAPLVPVLSAAPAE